MAWPGWNHLRYAALLSLANMAWFLLVYGGMDALTARRAPKAVQAVLWSWMVLIAASTVLTHQHHVLDAVTGWLLAVVCVKTVFHRLVPGRVPYTEAFRNDLVP